MVLPLKRARSAAGASLAVALLLFAGRHSFAENEPAWPDAAPTLGGVGGDDGFLKAKGADLRDHRGTGAVVHLRGVNLGGWLEWQPWMCPMDSSDTLKDANPGHNGYDFELRRLLTKRFDGPEAGSRVSSSVEGDPVDSLVNAYEDAWITTRDLDNIKALGMNVVRLTFAYDTLLNEDGSWRADAFKRLDWLVSNAWQRGIYTVLDYHAFLPACANQDGSSIGYWNDAAQQEETAKIWAHVAEHFKGNAAVAMYDLLNEPNNSAPKRKQEPKAAKILEVYGRLYHAIRQVDPDHAIAMEGVWDWTTLRDPHRAGFENVVYSLHWYHFGQNSLAENNARTDGDLAGAAQMCEQWKVPCFIGEFNLFGDPQAWKHALEGYNAAGLNWALWTYKNKGSGSDSWGVYTTLDGKAPPVPNLLTDSEEAIRSKWKAWMTTPRAFGLNPMLGPILKAEARQP